MAMRGIGIVRKVDELGRIVLPIELRRVMDLEVGDPVEVFIDDVAERFILRKYRTMACLFCNSSEDQLAFFRGYFACSTCLNALRSESG